MKSFNEFMKSPALGKAEKMDLLHKYRDHMMQGKGKRHKSHGTLIKEIKQHGGSFGHNQKGNGFFDWLKGAARTVYNKVLKPVGNAAYKHVIKPAYEYARDKPVSAVGHVLGAASMIPSPFSGALKVASAGAKAVGSAIGKGVVKDNRGNKREVTMHGNGKVLMIH